MCDEIGIFFVCSVLVILIEYVNYVFVDFGKGFVVLDEVVFIIDLLVFLLDMFSS